MAGWLRLINLFANLSGSVSTFTNPARGGGEKAFSAHNGPFVPCATNFASSILGNDVEEEQFTFTADVTGRGSDGRSLRGRGGMRGFDAYADGQLARRKIRSQQPCARHLHECHHSWRRKDRRKHVRGIIRQVASQIGRGNYKRR